MDEFSEVMKLSIGSLSSRVVRERVITTETRKP